MLINEDLNNNNYVDLIVYDDKNEYIDAVSVPVVELESSVKAFINLKEKYE